MRSMSRRLAHYANVIVTLAFVFALSGGAYAASRYAPTKQIEHSVLKQLRGAIKPAGPVGPAGPAGVKGDSRTDGDRLVSYSAVAFGDVAASGRFSRSPGHAAGAALRQRARKQPEATPGAYERGNSGDVTPPYGAVVGSDVVFPIQGAATAGAVLFFGEAEEATFAYGTWAMTAPPAT
jgi:hypothetical protein